jgi:hypothetical protein
MKAFISGIGDFLLRVISDPSAISIFIREVCICYIALGVRSTIKWFKMRKKRNPTRDFIAKIDDQVRGYLIASCLVVSMFSSWVYRYEFFPAGRILVDGKKISQYHMAFKGYEHMIGEGILFGFGAIGFMFFLKFIEWLWMAVDKKYNINIFKRRK